MSERRPSLSDVRRGTSTTLSYVFTLAIVALLMSGLLIAGGNFVEDQRQLVIDQELRVIGHQVASNVEKADRLANASLGSTTIQVNQTFPNQVTGSTYQIDLQADSDAAVVLTSTRPEVEVTVPLRNATDLQASSVDGGLVSVQYDESSDTLVILDE
jgi:hypothetical protein